MLNDDTQSDVLLREKMQYTSCRQLVLQRVDTMCHLQQYSPPEDLPEVSPHWAQVSTASRRLTEMPSLELKYHLVRQWEYWAKASPHGAGKPSWSLMGSTSWHLEKSEKYRLVQWVQHQEDWALISTTSITATESNKKLVYSKLKAHHWHHPRIHNVLTHWVRTVLIFQIQSHNVTSTATE